MILRTTVTTFVGVLPIVFPPNACVDVVASDRLSGEIGTTSIDLLLGAKILLTSFDFALVFSINVFGLTTHSKNQ